MGDNPKRKSNNSVYGKLGQGSMAKKKMSKESRDKMSKESREKVSKLSEADKVVFDVNDKLDPREPELNEEQKAALRAFVNGVIQTGIPKLKEEFAQLQKYKPPDVTREAQDQNRKKSRYKDVSCWDQTRVKLLPVSGLPAECSDFIHANYIKHALYLNQFICTQGPLESTVVDFWRLVWQERVGLVLMLCQCIEGKRPKCAEVGFLALPQCTWFQYWPTVLNTPKQVGPFSITNRSVDSAADPNITVSELMLEFDGQARRIEHRHFTGWPDKTVPKNATVAFRLLAHPRDYTGNPTIIHCSAGVGRTGSLIVLELILQSIRNLKKVDVMEMLKELRKQRSQMVQTEDQYVFVHFAMIQYAYITKVVQLSDVKAFVCQYERYLRQYTQEQEEKAKQKKEKDKGKKKGGRTLRKQKSRDDDDDDQNSPPKESPSPSPNPADFFAPPGAVPKS